MTLRPIPSPVRPAADAPEGHLCRGPARAGALALLAAALCGAPGKAAGPVRSLAQDPALDHLVHADRTVTAPTGTLGEIRRAGSGPRKMILLPGLGFGAGIWSELMERHVADATMYAVTLPGFGGTPPLAMPPPGSSFADTPWTRSAVAALERLIEEEKLERVTIVAHWALATQIALRLALDHPERVEALILVGGVRESYYDSSPQMIDWTLEQRARFADGMAQQWFRTVTRRTWDDNNFMTYDYAVDPLRALFLWREAQSPTLPVWIRYLLEFYAQDPTLELSKLKVPTLVVQPGFDDSAFYVDAGRNYMRNLCHDSWQATADLAPAIELVTVQGSRLFVQYDRPDELDRLIREFPKRGGR